MKKSLKKQLLVVVLVVSLAAAGCGYLLYPERRNQGTTGEIDPIVLVMDAAWLLFFIVPGVVALVVDFTTGGMYLEGTSLNIEPGRKMALRLRGAAPAAADLSVVITDGDDGKIVATLLDREFKAGEVMGDTPVFTIPEDLAGGDYTLNIMVNGVNNSSWDFTILQ